jgi:hypothetical protein
VYTGKINNNAFKLRQRYDEGPHPTVGGVNVKIRRLEPEFNPNGLPIMDYAKDSFEVSSHDSEEPMDGGDKPSNNDPNKTLKSNKSVRYPDFEINL